MAKPTVVHDWDDKAYMKFLPPHLQERYRDGVSDVELTHLVRQISLMDVRIKSLLETLDQQVLTKQEIAQDLLIDFPELSERQATDLAGFVMGYLPTGFINYRTFGRLLKMVDKYENAIFDGRDTEADRTLRHLFLWIREGRKDGDTWEDIQTAMDQRRKLVEAEMRRLDSSQQSLPLDNVVMLCGLLIESFKNSVTKYVQDREIQQYILEDADRSYQRQLGMGADRPADK